MNRPVFRLDQQEFGEVWYGMVARALNICPVGWPRDLRTKNQRLYEFFIDVFGHNSWKAGPNYKKKQFRNDLAKRSDEIGTLLVKWYSSACDMFDKPEVEPVPGDKVALIWNRRRDSDTERNSTCDSLKQLCHICKRKNYHTVLVGAPSASANAIGFDTDRSEFYGDYKINHIQQLMFLTKLIAGRPAVSIGLQSGAMDGLALFCEQRTVFLSRADTANNGMRALTDKFGNLKWCELKYEGKFKTLRDEELQTVCELLP